MKIIKEYALKLLQQKKKKQQKWQQQQQKAPTTSKKVLFVTVQTYLATNIGTTKIGRNTICTFNKIAVFKKKNI